MKLIVVVSERDELPINENILNGCEYVPNTQEAARLVGLYSGQDMCVQVGDDFYGAAEFLAKYSGKK